MKKALLIFCIFFSFSGITTVIKGQDTLVYAKKEILALKPLQYNTDTYNNFKNQKFYSYNEKIENKSILDILFEKFNSWLREVYQKTIERKDFNRLVWIIGILIFVILVTIIYLSNPGIFYLNKKIPLNYSVEDENIEIDDLDMLTDNAINDKRFSDAIRWQYLKTLKILHEGDYISYDAHKTVNEYVYEINNLNLRKDFRNLSNAFIYYRYGKAEADAEKFFRFQLAAKAIQKI